MLVNKICEKYWVNNDFTYLNAYLLNFNKPFTLVQSWQLGLQRSTVPQLYDNNQSALREQKFRFRSEHKVLLTMNGICHTCVCYLCTPHCSMMIQRITFNMLWHDIEENIKTLLIQEHMGMKVSSSLKNAWNKTIECFLFGNGGQ